MGGRNGSYRDVILADLSGTADNRRVMRTVARASVALETFVGRIRGRPGPTVLVFAPAADGKTVNWPAGADLMFTDELLDAGAIKRINDWVEALSARLVEEGVRLWPVDGGICFGDLNRAQLQGFLLDYAQATESLRRLLDAGHARRCLILSGYPDSADAFRRDVQGHTGSVRVHALPAIRPSILRRRSPPAPMPYAGPTGAAQPRVLIVSESRPMADLFSRVEQSLAAIGIGPNLRLQYGSSGGDLEVRDGTSRLNLVRPDLVAPDGPDFSSQLAGARERLQEIAAQEPLYRPPLGLLLEGVFAHTLPQQVRHLAEIRRIIAAARPELVVVGNDRWWIGMAAVLVARQAGIPTLAVQDGVAWETPMWGFSTADYIAVNGTQLEDFLVKRGHAPERIRVVGQPRYDTYTMQHAAALREAARERLGLAPGRFAVLFATQPNQDASYVRQVADAILAEPDLVLLLRPHPSTPARPRAELDRIAGRPRVTAVAEGEIFDLIAAADLVVVQNSTVALEAALAGRPVITANLTGNSEVVPYSAMGLSLEAKDPGSVRDLVARAVEGQLATRQTDERARQGIYHLIGPTDGSAATRVADMVRDLLKSRATA